MLGVTQFTIDVGICLVPFHKPPSHSISFVYEEGEDLYSGSFNFKISCPCVLSLLASISSPDASALLSILFSDGCHGVISIGCWNDMNIN